MSWNRRPKPAAEPTEDTVKPVPRPTQSGSDKYCPRCETWYKPGDTSHGGH